MKLPKLEQLVEELSTKATAAAKEEEKMKLTKLEQLAEAAPGHEAYERRKRWLDQAENKVHGLAEMINGTVLTSILSNGGFPASEANDLKKALKTLYGELDDLRKALMSEFG